MSNRFSVCLPDDVFEGQSEQVMTSVCDMERGWMNPSDSAALKGNTFLEQNLPQAQASVAQLDDSSRLQAEKQMLQRCHSAAPGLSVPRQHPQHDRFPLMPADPQAGWGGEAGGWDGADYAAASSGPQLPSSLGLSGDAPQALFRPPSAPPEHHPGEGQWPGNVLGQQQQQQAAQMAALQAQATAQLHHQLLAQQQQQQQHRMMLESLKRQEAQRQSQAQANANLMRDFPQLAQAQQLLAQQQARQRAFVQQPPAMGAQQMHPGYAPAMQPAHMEAAAPGQQPGGAPNPAYLSTMRQLLLSQNMQAMNQGYGHQGNMAAYLQTQQSLAMAAAARALQQQQQQQATARRQQEQMASAASGPAGGAPANQALLMQQLQQLVRLQQQQQQQRVLRAQTLDAATFALSMGPQQGQAPVPVSSDDARLGAVPQPSYGFGRQSPIGTQVPYRQSSPSLGVLAAAQPVPLKGQRGSMQQLQEGAAGMDGLGQAAPTTDQCAGLQRSASDTVQLKAAELVPDSAAVLPAPSELAPGSGLGVAPPKEGNQSVPQGSRLHQYSGVLAPDSGLEAELGSLAESMKAVALGSGQPAEHGAPGQPGIGLSPSPFEEPKEGEGPSDQAPASILGSARDGDDEGQTLPGIPGGPAPTSFDAQNFAFFSGDVEDALLEPLGGLEDCCLDAAGAEFEGHSLGALLDDAPPNLA